MQANTGTVARALRERMHGKPAGEWRMARMHAAVDNPQTAE